MRRLFFVCAVASLLVAVGPMAWAATNLNTSRSNIYRLVYDTIAVTPAQATTILTELNKIGPGVNEATVRKLLQKQGVNLSLIQKIDIVPAGQRSEKIPAILILKNPADGPAAREIAVSDSGVVTPKPVPIPIKK